MSRRCVYWGLEIVFQLRLKVGQIWFSARKNSNENGGINNNNNNNKEIDSSYPFLSRSSTPTEPTFTCRREKKKMTQSLFFSVKGLCISFLLIFPPHSPMYSFLERLSKQIRRENINVCFGSLSSLITIRETFLAPLRASSSMRFAGIELRRLILCEQLPASALISFFLLRTAEVPRKKARSRWQSHQHTSVTSHGIWFIFNCLLTCTLSSHQGKRKRIEQHYFSGEGTMIWKARKVMYKGFAQTHIW